MEKLMINLFDEAPPPTAELMHYQLREVNPSFVVIKNGPTLFATADDYYFTYDDAGYCHGGYYASIDYARGFGVKSPTTVKEGFGLGAKMNLGFYDASKDKYYQLVTDEELIYKNLGLYKVVAVKGPEIDLNIHQALLTPVLEFEHLKDSFDVYKENKLFFEVKGENLKSIEVELLKGDGTLRFVDRYVDDHFVNVEYTGDANEKEVIFKISGETLFGDDLIEKTATVEVTNSSLNPEPKLDETVVYDDDYFDVFLSNEAFYMRAKSNVPVYANFHINGVNKTKYLVSSRPTKPGDVKLITKTDGLNVFKLNWAMYKGIDGLKSYQWTQKRNINQLFEL